MKLLSWNVNGLRAVLKKGFLDFVERYRPDILCLQEIKVPGEPIQIDLKEYYRYWNPAQRKGYAGTAIFSKQKLARVTNDMGMDKHDGEGRVMTAELEDFYLVNVYTPNSKRGLERLAYRQKEWDVDFLKYLKTLERKKPVIFCGDLNVAHKEIDLKNPQANIRHAGFTIEEREGFDNLIKAGFIDTFREFTKEGGHYTWWSYMANARARNIGWRIDYVCISPSLRPRLKEAFILPEVMGSDHCPVGIVLR